MSYSCCAAGFGPGRANSALDLQRCVSDLCMAHGLLQLAAVSGHLPATQTHPLVSARLSDRCCGPSVPNPGEGGGDQSAVLEDLFRRLRQIKNCRPGGPLSVEQAIRP